MLLMSADSFTVTNTMIDCRGQLIDLKQPRVMGILNLTPDSFCDGGMYNIEEHKFLEQAEKHLEEKNSPQPAILCGNCCTAFAVQKGNVTPEAFEQDTKLWNSLLTDHQAP